MSNHEPTKDDGSPRTGALSLAEIMSRPEFRAFALDEAKSLTSRNPLSAALARRAWAFYLSARKAFHSGVLGALVAAVAMQVRVVIASNGGVLPSWSTLGIAVLVGAASGVTAYYSRNITTKDEPSP